MQDLIAAETRVRTAIAARSYEQAAMYLAEYCDVLEKEFREASHSEVARTGIEHRAREFFRWSNRSARTGRAHLCDQLLALPRRSPYQAPAARPMHTWRIDG